jgi:hypothetical protein
VRYGPSVNPAPIFRVVGAPAVGKSAVSRALAQRFERREQLDPKGCLVLDDADRSPDEAAARIVADAGLSSATGEAP